MGKMAADKNKRLVGDFAKVHENEMRTRQVVVCYWTGADCALLKPVQLNGPLPGRRREMMKVSKSIHVFAAAVALAAASAAHASVFITEYMYNGLGTSSAGEYVELLNTGPAPVDMTGWSFDDSSATAGSFSLSALGTLAVGQYAIITDVSAATFVSNWSLDASVKVIGGNNQNLGRSDAINIFDASNAVEDHLTYDDQTLGGPRANNVSANFLPADYGSHDPTRLVLSAVGDQFGSYESGLHEVGNPGVVPEPTSVLLLSGAAAMLVRRRRSL